jgi:hypothetical protein
MIGLKMNFSLTCSAVHSSPDASFHRVQNAMDRKMPRQPVGRPSMIMVGNRGSLPCRISNLSRSGAMVLISNVEWLPNTFELADTFSGVRRQGGLEGRKQHRRALQKRRQNWLHDATALISAGHRV